MREKVPAAAKNVKDVTAIRDTKPVKMFSILKYLKKVLRFNNRMSFWKTMSLGDMKIVYCNQFYALALGNCSRVGFLVATQNIAKLGPYVGPVVMPFIFRPEIVLEIVLSHLAPAISWLQRIYGSISDSPLRDMSCWPNSFLGVRKRDSGRKYV